MRRYTTPTVTVEVEGVDLTTSTVLVTFQQRSNRLTVEGPSMALQDGNTVISIPLSQLQTGGFAEGSVEVQVNWLDSYGHRDATTVGAIQVERNLLAEVVDE